jgi:hypothetical protein
MVMIIQIADMIAFKINKTYSFSYIRTDLGIPLVLFLVPISNYNIYDISLICLTRCFSSSPIIICDTPPAGPWISTS